MVINMCEKKIRLMWIHFILKFFKSRLVTKVSKFKLYRTVIRPIVTYASETWVLKENIIQKLLVFERKILKYLGLRKKIKHGGLKTMKN